jgi:hypothetical protein
MGQKLHWRPSRRQMWFFAGIVAALGILLVFVGGYYFNWTWSGFGPHTNADGKIEPARTLWDWMQLLIIPAVLAGGALWFNQRNTEAQNRIAQLNTETQNRIAEDNQHEAALQKYIDKMSALLLDKGLGSENDAEIRNVARTRTLFTLRTLDETRKGLLLRFLWESRLIDTTNPILNLTDADLTAADLRHADLSKANLDGANLADANLAGAVLFYTKLDNAKLAGAKLAAANMVFATLVLANLNHGDLRHANLTAANLSSAMLTGANLESANLERATLNLANLSDAKVTPEQLAKAKSLKGAIMPDGTKHG